MDPGILFLCFHLFQYLTSIYAQSISTNTPVPPTQWINLSQLLQGSSAPPPLRDAALGYDEISRSLIIFGGESEGGFVQSQTFLLKLDTLTWSIPAPPANLPGTPPARSSAISGLDFAASNRHAFIVIGGKGPGGVALSDAWAYDFINQFWSEIVVSPGQPSPRWGASGGIDIRSIPIQDVVVAGPNNSFYLAGGFDGTTAFPLSDTWRFNISGTLSSNLPNSVQGSWEKMSLKGTLPLKVRQGGTVIGQQIISTGGCNITLNDDNDDPSCAQQDSYVIDTQRLSSISPASCPAPRLGPVLIPNFNPFSSAFASQVFLTLGTFNESLWGAPQNGEIDVLDTNTGSWSRVLPAGDPGTTGKATYPGPREGAASFSFATGLVGNSRNTVSDTIIFGGRDISGNYLSEMWLLRTFSGSLTAGSTWPGFGNGQLQTGVNADGSGVNVQYLTQCALFKSPTGSVGGGNSSSPPSTPPAKSTPTPTTRYDTHLTHKLLSPLSLAILLLSFLLLRSLSSRDSARYRILFTFSIALAVSAYIIGVIGIIFAFTSLSNITLDSTSHTSVTSKNFIKTTHGIVSFAFFLCLYGLVAALVLALASLERVRGPSSDLGSQMTELQRQFSNNTAEKPDHVLPSSRSPSQTAFYSPSASPRPRTQSWGPSAAMRRSLDALSSDGESVTSGTPHRGFEVLNRPVRTRKPSENSQPLPSSSRSLGDVDWMLRRRSLNAVGELDYAIGLAHNMQQNSRTPGVLPPAAPQSLQPKCERPSILGVLAYILTQISFMGLNITTLIILWSRAPKAIFIVFLIWVVGFYILLFILPRKFQSEIYLLACLSRKWGTRETPHDPASVASATPIFEPTVPLSPQGPYIHHRPPYRMADLGDASHANGDPRSAETDEDDDIDEETRQRMIEEEMDRRDVSIVTVPKRKLWVVNPSS